MKKKRSKKGMIRRITSSILTLLMVFSIMDFTGLGSAIAKAETAESYGSLIATGPTGQCTYTIYDSDNDNIGDLLVISGEGAMEDSYHTYESGRKTSAPWENDAYSIRKLIVEYGVTSISKYMFYYNGDTSNNGLTTVQINTNEAGKSTVKIIGERSFYGSTITEMNFPEGIETIGTMAFWSAELNSVQLPEGLRTIDVSAFKSCNIRSIIVPSTVTSIGNNTLMYYDYSTHKAAPMTVYYLCEARDSYNTANNAYKITKEVDGETVSNRYILPESIANGTIYMNSVWDASTGFPSKDIEDELAYTWFDADNNKYTNESPATVTADTIFRRYSYEMKSVIFDVSHVTVEGSPEVKVGETAENYVCTLTAKEEYLALEKSDISVKIGENTLTDSDFTFALGTLTIPKEVISDDIIIKVTARPDTSKYKANLTVDGITTSYFNFGDAYAAIGENSEAMITLTQDNILTLTNYIEDSSHKLTIDLNGKTLKVEGTPTKNMSFYLQNGADWTVISSESGGIVDDSFATMYVFSASSGGRLTLDENVEIRTAVNVAGITYEGNGDFRGAIMDKAVFKGNQCKVTAGTIGTLVWSRGNLSITGGNIGLLKVWYDIKLNNAFPTGYVVKNSISNSLYTRADVDAITVDSDYRILNNITVVPCTNHENDKGFCKYCNTEILCDHSFDEGGICTKCGMISVASMETSGETKYYNEWIKLCEAAKNISGEATIKLFDSINNSNTILSLSDGKITLDLNGKTIYEYNNSVLNVLVNADVTVKNGILISDDRSNTIEVYGGNLTLDNTVTVKGSSNYGYNISLLIYGGTVTIDGANIEGNTYVSGGTVKASGGVFDALILEGGNFSIEDGYALKLNDGTWTKEVLNERYENVSVKKIPFTDGIITTDNQSIIYGVESVLKASPVDLYTDNYQDEDISFEWYKKLTEDDVNISELNDTTKYSKYTGATSSELTIPADTSVGTNTFICVLSCDGYSVTATKTVTVTCDHTKGNLNSDGTCSICGEKLKYIVQGYMKDESGNGVAGQMTGLALYANNEEATITAPFVTGYNFLGWYAYDKDNSSYYSGDNLCTSRIFTFKVTNDVDLVAVYKPLGKASVTINGGTSFTINGDTKSSQITAEYFLGSSITVATDAIDFAYWANSYGMVVSRDKNYSFTVSGAETVTAVFNTVVDNKATVIFESYYGQVIARDQLEEGNKTFSVPSIPTKYGYTALGWDMDGDGTYNAESDTLVAAIVRGLEAEDKIVTIIPIYEINDMSYSIEVTSGTGAGTFKQNEVVSVLANAPENGYKFSHWKDSSDTILSYNETYKFFAEKNISLTAVYVADADIVEAKGTTEIIDMYKDETNYKLSFVSMSTVPDGCVINKAGVIATKDSIVGTSGDGFNASTAAYVRGNAWSGNAYRYTWSKGNVSTNDTWYVRAYLVYTDVNGNIVTVYGNVVQQTF